MLAGESVFKYQLLLVLAQSFIFSHVRNLSKVNNCQEQPNKNRSVLSGECHYALA